ncbi:hypothetical protein ACC728_39950, partial [Rhizobium ruizarguesonis]
DDKSSTTKDYIEKIVKIIPSEIIAGYLALIGLVPSIKNENSHQGFYYGIFVLCTILTPVYFNWQADKGKPKVVHIVL